MPADFFEQTLDYLSGGGGVMYPLIIISLWMWWLILKKTLEFSAMRRQEQTVKQCLEAFSDQKTSGAPWQREALSIAQDISSTAWATDKSRISRLTRGLEQKTEQGIGTILVLAEAAPLLGLLGTVCGMIHTFEVITLFGTGKARPMASGISEALITTQTGLLVAVPGLVLGTLLKRRAESIKVRIPLFCLAAVREIRGGQKP